MAEAAGGLRAPLPALVGTLRRAPRRARAPRAHAHGHRRYLRLRLSETTAMLDHSVQRHPLAERGHDLCETPAEIPSDQLGAVAMTGGRASRQKGNRAERAI